MSNYKFDQFYYSIDKSSEHYLSEIISLSDEELNLSYKGKMYCPLCKGPQLSLVKKEGKAHLRTYPKQPHIIVDQEMCMYACDTASSRIVEEYIEELRSKKKIKSLLEATMRLMLKPNIPKAPVPRNTGNTNKNPLIIETKQISNNTKKNIVPHYSFRSWGENIPQDQLLIVYGKVYLEVKEIPTSGEKDENTITTFVRFRDIKSKKLITSCIKPNDIEINNGNYYAVVLGKCKKKESKETTYYNIWINSPVNESMLIKPFPL